MGDHVQASRPSRKEKDREAVVAREFTGRPITCFLHREWHRPNFRYTGGELTRPVSSRAVGVVLAAAPRRARRLRAGLAAGHQVRRAPGWGQRGHRNCPSISCAHRPGALPGHGAGSFHRLNWYHVGVSGTIKEASGRCPERSVGGDARGYRPLSSISRHVTRGHVSSSTDIMMHGREGL
jgi:hypothetical protein